MLNQNNLKITVAIPCFNEAKNIGKAIESILKQRHPADEIIVVDDGSTDNSVSIIEKYPVRIIKHEQNFGLAIARNIAWRNASGDIIVYIDADAVADERLLELILKEYDDSKIVGVGGQSIELYTSSIFDRWRALFHSQSLGSKRIERVSMLAGLCSSYRKDILTKLDGFDEIYKTHAEDVDFGMRLTKNNYQLLYNPAIKVYHKRDDTFWSLYKYVYRHIYWSCISRRRNGKRTLMKFLLGALSFSIKAVLSSLMEYKSLSLMFLSVIIFPVRFSAAVFGSLVPIGVRRISSNQKHIMIINLSDLSHSLCGGQEISIYNLVKYLDKNRFNITVVLPKYGPVINYFRKLDIEVIILPLRKWYNFIYIFKLCLIMKNKRIDILHTHEPRGNLFGLIAAKFASVPKLVSTRHDMYLSKYMKRRFYLKRKCHMLIDRFVFRFYDKVIAVSYFIRKELINLQKIPLSKVEVIYYGLNEAKFLSQHQINSLREEFYLNTGDRTVGLVARILPDKKGHFYFLEAAKKILRKNRNIKFFLVGLNGNKDCLLAHIDRLGIGGNVILTGHRQDINRFYQMLDLVVLPSLWEGLPLALLEASSYGKPILGTAVGGIPEIIEDKVNGILVAPADSDVLAREMWNILQDRNLAQKLSETGRKKAVQFTMDKMIKAVEEIYLG